MFLPGFIFNKSKMKKQDKLHCEKSKWERIKQNYAENSMLIRFYDWINREKEKKKNDN